LCEKVVDEREASMSTSQQSGEIYEPFLHSGQIIPAFNLPGADGMPHGPWDYKQREHLILLFIQGITDNESRGLLRAFAKRYRDFRQEDCAILAVSPDPVIANLEAQETLQLPFALLSNPDGSVIRKYTLWDATKHTCKPAIVLADRYNALYQQWIANSEATLPAIDELLESLRYLNKLCTP
jgi:peroxiredoxin